MSPSHHDQLVGTLLDGLGVRAHRVAPGVMLLAMDVSDRHYRRSALVELRSSEYWLTVRSYMYTNIQPEELRAVACHLAHLNSHARGVRFCLAERTVYIQSEVPVSRLAKETLAEMLYVVAQATKTTVQEVVLLATSVAAAQAYEKIHCASFPVDGLPSAGLDERLRNIDLRPIPIERFAPKPQETPSE